MVFRLIPCRREQHRVSGGYLGPTKTPAVSPRLREHREALEGCKCCKCGEPSTAGRAGRGWGWREWTPGWRCSRAVFGFGNALAAAVGVADVARAARQLHLASRRGRWRGREGRRER